MTARNCKINVIVAISTLKRAVQHLGNPQDMNSDEREVYDRLIREYKRLQDIVELIEELE